MRLLFLFISLTLFYFNSFSQNYQIVTDCGVEIVQNNTTIFYGDSLNLVASDLIPSQTSPICLLSDLPLSLTNGLSHYYPFCGNANDIVNDINGTSNGATLSDDRSGNNYKNVR